MNQQNVDQACSSSCDGIPGQRASPFVTQCAGFRGHMTGHESQHQTKGYPGYAVDANNHHSTTGSIADFPRAASTPERERADEPNNRENALPATITALQNRITELNNQNLELILDYNEYKRSISRLQGEKDDLEQRHNSSLEEARAVQQIVFNLARDVQSLGDQNSQLKFAVQDLEECLQENISTHAQKLEDQQLRHDAETLELDGNLRSLRDQLAASNRKVESAEGLAGDLKADRVRLKVVVEQLQKMVVDGMRGQKMMVADNERLEKARLKQEQRTLDGINPAESNSSSLEQECRELAVAVSQLTTEATMNNTRISDLETDKSLVRDAIQQLAGHSARIGALEIKTQTEGGSLS